MVVTTSAPPRKDGDLTSQRRTLTDERLTGQTRKVINRKVREEQIKWQNTDTHINEAKRGLRKGSGGTQPGHNTSGRP